MGRVGRGHGRGALPQRVARVVHVLSGEVGKRGKKCTLTSKEILN